jgi:cardiolipin synthase
MVRRTVGQETDMDDTWWKLLIAGIWLIYLIVLGAMIILQKRDPAATLGWLLGLAALPVIGLLIYHFFGPQRIKRHRLKRSRFAIRQPHIDDFETMEAAELSRMSSRITGLPMSSADNAQLLIDGAAKYASLISDVACAQREIHLEYYIYEPDQTGGELRKALIERAQNGVKVRLLVDAIGAVRARKFFSDLQDAGGEVAWFHPTRFGHVWTRPWVNMRTHRKIAIIDGRIGYTGGINITDEENESLRDDAYRDLHVRLEGRVVHSLQQVFVEDWAYATGDSEFLNSAEAMAPPLPARGGISAQVITSGPDNMWEPIHRLHVGAIHAAHERVWLTTPYFVPSEAAIMALTSAALSGVDVRVLIPKRSDSRLVTMAARSYFDVLLEAGVKIHEYAPRMLHTKALVVDDNIAIIGTANFDQRSFRLNFEVAVLFDDVHLNTQMAELFEHELSTAPKVSKDRKRPLLSSQLPEGIARLASPLL